MRNRFRKLLDFDFVFIPGEKALDSNNILLHKGNQLHEIFIFTVLFLGLFYSIVNYLNGFPFAALITSFAIPLSIIAYVLNSAGYIFISKLWNTLQQILIITLICLTSAHEGGTIVFFIPIITGILITFQGKEKKVGYVFATFTLILSLIILNTEFKLAQYESSPENLHIERILNYTGAAVATLLELIFILKLSDSFQDKLMVNSRQLLSKNKELLKANSELDNFVYRVSHDLRSPLLSVKGLLSLASQQVSMDEKSQNYLKKADASINRLDEIIREILEYSRNSRMTQKLEQFNLRRMAELIFEDLRYLAGPKFSFELSIEGSSEVISDSYRVNTILRNLVSNAVKYQRKDIPDPKVKVSVRQQAKSIVIEVADNGEGIPEASLTRVFEMFYRATNSTPGTGLGLYICKEIVEKLNGDIKIHSQQGIGTTVKVELPLKKLKN